MLIAAMESSRSRGKNKIDRKTIERNRRIQMKGLCSQLVSLIPDHHFITIPKNMLAQQDLFDMATSYIMTLRERTDELRRRKTELMKTYRHGGPDNMTSLELEVPKVEVKEYGGSEVEVVLTCGVHRKLMLHQLIRILEEEGAEVLTVGVSAFATRIFHTLHAQIKVPRVGVDTSRISERIHDLSYDLKL